MVNKEVIKIIAKARKAGGKEEKQSSLPLPKYNMHAEILDMHLFSSYKFIMLSKVTIRIKYSQKGQSE